MADLERIVSWMNNHEQRLHRLETQEIGVASGGGRTLIEEKSLSSGTSTTFSSIAQTYTDLQLVWKAQSDHTLSEVTIYLQFNGDTAGNYYDTIHQATDDLGGGSDIHSVGGGGGGATELRIGLITAEVDASVDADQYGYGVADIPYYAEDPSWKMVLSRSGNWRALNTDNVRNTLFAGEWHDSDSISSITFGIVGGAEFSGDTKIALYGLS